MSAIDLLTPVVSHIAAFLGFFAVVLLGFSLIRMVGGKS